MPRPRRRSLPSYCRRGLCVCALADSAARHAERFVHDGIFVAERAGNQPRHRVQNHRRGQFAARQHEIADRNLIRREMFGDALVHAFVAAADEARCDRASRIAAPFPAGISCPPRKAARSRCPGARRVARLRAPPKQRFHRLEQRLGLHHHAFAAAERAIVHGAMAIVSEARKSWTCVSIRCASRARRTMP